MCLYVYKNHKHDKFGDVALWLLQLHFLDVKFLIVDTSKEQVNSFLRRPITALRFKKTRSILRLGRSLANDYTRHVFLEQIGLPKWPLRRHLK